MKTLIAGHQELGDAIVLNGLVRHLTSLSPTSQYLWLVNARNVESVRRMMVDVPNLEVTGTNGYPDVKAYWLPKWPDAIKLGFFNPGEFDQQIWDQEFYRHAGVPFDVRWTDFKFPGFYPVPRPTAVLVHEDLSRGYRIALPNDVRYLATYITPRPCLFDWLPEILGARELHVIDSAVLNLAESLYAIGGLRNTRLVFHRYAKKYPGPARWPTLRAPWEVIQ